MNGAARDDAGSQLLVRALVWALAAAVAALSHLSLAWILLRAPSPPQIPAQPAILLDLEPPRPPALERAPSRGSALPGNTPSAAPAPERPKPEPAKPETPKPEPPKPDPPKPETLRPERPLPNPQPVPQQAPAPRPPPVAAKPSARPGPTPYAPQRPGVTVESWQGLLTDKLERAKRFPVESQAQRLLATPKVRFTIDRAGRVRSAGIDVSSGSAALDDEAVAIVLRADPLPPPPADVDGDLIELSVFVRFSLCDRAAPPATVRCF